MPPPHTALTNVNSSPGFSYTELPSEIRLCIYDYLFAQLPDTVVIARTFSALPGACDVNRRTRAESAEHRRRYWAETTFIYRATSPDTFGFSPLVSWLNALGTEITSHLHRLEIHIDDWMVHNIRHVPRSLQVFSHSQQVLVQMFQTNPGVLRTCIKFVDIRPQGFHTRAPDFASMKCSLESAISNARKVCCAL